MGVCDVCGCVDTVVIVWLPGSVSVVWLQYVNGFSHRREGSNRLARPHGHVGNPTTAKTSRLDAYHILSKTLWSANCVY